ncbi:MAG: helix-turn-helix transcriptional regulator [Bacteroidales bacterium]|jgi:transcriptional regulator with XRE-family HTH domain|nr:helix-turn-helix transcriptional regulator [Bacteroidales bacterium]
MKNRILKFLEVENINPSKFADEIGVQRSSISHILSGRNNPSLELIQKILTRFNYINAEWLITGKGDMFKPNREPSLFDALYTKNETKVEIEQNTNLEETTIAKEQKKSDEDTKKQQDIPIQALNDKQNTPLSVNPSKVKKIILLYEDGKAEIYFP